MCKSAGAAVDKLAGESERDGKSVLFLEHNIDEPQGVRIDRWYDAYGAQPTFSYPLVMVDSGYRVSGGYEDFEVKYQAMVNDALARPPGADLSAWYQRQGQDIDATVSVTNRSGVDWTPEHLATVNLIVFERVHALQTGRIVRAATARYTGALANNATGTYNLSLVNVPVVSWDRGVVLALIEYRPDPANPPFDMLQAAIAVEGGPPTATPTPTPRPTRTPGGPPVEGPIFLPSMWR